MVAPFGTAGKSTTSKLVIAAGAALCAGILLLASASETSARFGGFGGMGGFRGGGLGGLGGMRGGLGGMRGGLGGMRSGVGGMRGGLKRNAERVGRPRHQPRRRAARRFFERVAQRRSPPGGEYRITTRAFQIHGRQRHIEACRRGQFVADYTAHRPHAPAEPADQAGCVGPRHSEHAGQADRAGTRQADHAGAERACSRRIKRGAPTKPDGFGRFAQHVDRLSRLGRRMGPQRQLRLSLHADRRGFVGIEQPWSVFANVVANPDGVLGLVRPV